MIEHETKRSRKRLNYSPSFKKMMVDGSILNYNKSTKFDSNIGNFIVTNFMERLSDT